MRFVDYDTGSVGKSLEAEESEDTDCDGSSLPEDSPEVQDILELISLAEIEFLQQHTFSMRKYSVTHLIH